MAAGGFDSGPLPAFPTLAGLAWPMVRTPIWKTLQQEALSGKSTRVPLWTYPRYRWTLSIALLRASASLAEYQSLIGFFNKISGGALPFWFTDPDDSVVTAQLIGTGDGVTRQFQMIRTIGGYTEPVYPFSPAFVTAGAASATVTAAGIATFATAPAAAVPVNWTGTFRYCCAMDADTIDLSSFGAGMYEANKISFTSIKP